MDDTDIDPEIAAAMGFGSFGAQPQNKRRKFNHDTDTFIEGQGEKKTGSTTPSGSGANMTALGVRSKVANNGPTQNHGGSSADTANNAAEQENKSQEKAKEKKKQGGAPRGLADYVAWGNKVAPNPAPVVEHAAGSGTVPEQASMAPVTEAPRGGEGAESWPQGMPSQDELAALRRGVRNSKGDTAYFLPSFIEDPWKSLVG